MDDLTTLTPRPRFPEAPPAQLTLVQAVWRNVWLVALPVVILAVVALAIGLLRSPTYTSASRLNVGGLDLTEQSIPGYVTAVQALAVSYADAIDAPGVVDPVARELHVSPNYVRSHVSATPVQNTPVITVYGRSKRPGEAQEIADAVGNSVVSYATQLNSGTYPARRLLQAYEASSRSLGEANAALDRLGPHDSGRQAAQSRVDLARLQFNTDATLYTASRAGEATTNLVQKLAPAEAATSDRKTLLLDLLAGALIGGLLIGVGLAVGRANALSTRRLEGL